MQPLLKRDYHASTHAMYYRFRKYKCRSLEVSVFHSRRTAFCQTRGDKIAPYCCSFHTFKVHKNNLKPLSIIKHSESLKCPTKTTQNVPPRKKQLIELLRKKRENARPEQMLPKVSLTKQRRNNCHLRGMTPGGGEENKGVAYVQDMSHCHRVRKEEQNP